MGRHDIALTGSPEELARFEERLIDDADALESMLAQGLFETGARRIGIEMEFFLIDEHGQPAPRAMEVLESLGADGTIYQTELALFNVEVALEPRDFTGDCFGMIEADLRRHVAEIRRAAERHGVDVLGIGILPTLGWEHLGLDYMTPSPRYAALNEQVLAQRGGDFRIQIRGTDSLQATHDNVLLEAFNTSFQLHLQVAPDEFSLIYNAMQLATAPVLAASGNSPLLLGARLWEETRIALFRQSVETRSDHHMTRGSRPRVFFGDKWITGGVLEIWREDISRYRVVLPMDERTETPQEELARGQIPKLSALALHNGTIYRWNRPCYGVAGGVPHLRIENRPLPAGPTAVDATANAAYLYGLTLGIAKEFGDVSGRMPFHDCQANFYNAASNGLRASLHWVDGRSRPADELVLLTLPLAAQGLRDHGVEEGTINRLLDLISERVTSGQTGSRWLLNGFNKLRHTMPKDEASQSLVLEYARHQRIGEPVHTWGPAQLPDRERRRAAYQRVGQIMTTDLVTVQARDNVSLAEAMMRWEKIRHVPVEDEDGDLVGIFSMQDLVRVMKEVREAEEPITIGEIMQKNVVTVAPETATLEAIKIMRENKFSALPVVREGKLVGIITEADFLLVTQRLLE